MGRIVFVYAGDPGNGEIRSPYSITRNLCAFLRTKAEVAYHEWTSSGPISLQPDDVFLGHPNYPEHTVTQWVFRHGNCRAKCLIHPLHTAMVGDNMPFDAMARWADAIFSIMGPYWYDTLESTPFAHWKPKITRLDMAVDGQHFPYLRTRFKEPGQRRLLYVGSSTPHKNLEFMARLISSMPDVQLDWYGGSSDHQLARLPNVRTYGWLDLSRPTAQRLVDECDIFVNTSISDANPTTLLEAAAWGIIPLCTKESGYYSDQRNDHMFGGLYLEDLDKSIQSVRHWLTVDQETLLVRARANRALVESRYNWSVFCDRLWSRLQTL